MPAATEGFDELMQALEQAREIALPLGEQAVAVGLTAIRSQMAPYPPQPDRDRAKPPGGPSPYNTYVRGIGQFPRSSFAQVDGKWERKKKGAYKPGPKGGTVRRTSQEMNKKWRMQVRREGNTVVGELENQASYSGQVMGHKPGADNSDGIDYQRPYHAETGWTNVDDAINAARPAFDQAVSQAIDAIVDHIKGTA
jgi:hypothetical protein